MAVNPLVAEVLKKKLLCEGKHNGARVDARDGLEQHTQNSQEQLPRGRRRLAEVVCTRQEGGERISGGGGVERLTRMFLIADPKVDEVKGVNEAYCRVQQVHGAGQAHFAQVGCVVLQVE